MIYEFKCKWCQESEDFVRSVEERNLPVICERCGIYAERVFASTVNNKVDTFEPGYNPAFGRVFGSRSELKNELTKIKRETGREFVEIGNEHKFPKKDTRLKVDKQSVAEHYRALLRHGHS